MLMQETASLQIGPPGVLQMPAFVHTDNFNRLRWQDSTAVAAEKKLQRCAGLPLWEWIL